MCYSSESSLRAFIIGELCCMYLIFFSNNNANKHIGLIFSVVTLMQLLEYFIWSDQECVNTNEIASRLLTTQALLQLWIVYVGALLYNTTVLSNELIYLLLFIFSCLLIYYFWNDFIKKDNRKWCTKPNEYGSLQWANFPYDTMFFKNDVYIYYLIVFSTPFVFKDKKRASIASGLAALTYISNKHLNKGLDKSRWCYYSAFIPALLVLLECV